MCQSTTQVSPPAVLDSLRQPLETGETMIARANGRVTFPSRFQLVAAMNPCKCGLAGTPGHTCRRGDACAADYQGRVSGPFLDRIDIRIDVPAVTATELIKRGSSENSASVAARVAAARLVQRDRYRAAGHPGVFTNAAAPSSLIETVAKPDREGEKLLITAAEKFRLSARAYGRVMKVARTLADLAGAASVGRAHIAEALGYRISLGGA